MTLDISNDYYSSETSDSTPELRAIFEEGGLLQKYLTGYECRLQQIQMAEAIQQAIQSNTHLLVEAGTGVGKSLAYLIPFVKWARESKKRVVVSTYTKTLQEQLVKRDLPFLQRVLDMDFKFALCVGTENYLCLRRFRLAHSYDLFDNNSELNQIQRIDMWLNETKSGLISDLDFEPEESLWAKICRQSDLCLGRRCLFRKDCFYNKAREKEEGSHILVVNHHLFLANTISGGRVLPYFEAVVFDEAHTLQDVATEYLGIEVTNFKIKYFLDTIFNPQSGKGFLHRLQGVSRKKISDIKGALDKVRLASERFFCELVRCFGEESKTQRIRGSNFIFNYLQEPLLHLSCLLSAALDSVTSEDDRVQIKSYILRAKEINSGLEAIITQSLQEHVYWIEILNRQGRRRYSLHTAPIDISEEFKTRVLEEVELVIFTSATLSVNGDFNFIKQSLGIEQAKEICLSSPFEYSRNAIIYIPHNLPDPNREFESYQKEAIEEIKRILVITQGRAFVLFTNYRMLDMANDILRQELSNFNILRQGDAPRYKLLERFKADTRSVLLGTNTFWQGVDVPGRALECVIITKLPFAVPDEPIIEARMELLRAQNKDPFIDYQIPQAIIMLRQGFGRLIRRKTDIGMVAILDPRIKTRFYGKSFLEALPQCQRVYELSEVHRFLQSIPYSVTI